MLIWCWTQSWRDRYIKGGEFKAKHPQRQIKRTFWAHRGAAELQVMVLLITSPAVCSDECSNWWKMRLYAAGWTVVWQTALRNSWSVLMKLVMNYFFKWQNMLLSLAKLPARSPGNVLCWKLLLCAVEQEWSVQAHWFSIEEWLLLCHTIIIAQMRHLKVNIHLNTVVSGILLSCNHQAMAMGLQRSGQ